MGRINVNGRTIAYALLMAGILFAVGYLMTRIARTDEATRYLATIAAVIAAAIVLGGLGAMGVRGRRSNKDEPSSG